MICRPVAVVLGVLLLTLALLPEIAEARKSILLVFDEDKDFPGLAIVNRSLREVFRSEFEGNVEFYSESLNLSQFRDQGHDGVLRDYYRRKYANTQLDLIVAIMGPSLEFLLRHGEALFPGIPIVFCGAGRSDLEGKTLGANVTGVLVKREFAPTLEIALRLQPDTGRVFVVGGTSSFDRQLQAIARRDFEPFERRAVITYLTALPMDDLLQTLSRLPPHSLVLYLTLLADGAGRAFVPHDALELITRAANAPVYVSVDQYLGRGAVGGHVYSLNTHGRHAAELGLRILRGEAPANIPIAEQAAHTDIFDWRQLRRWGLDESRLPPGAVIAFAQPTVWERYRWYIIAALSIIMIQGWMIGDLLLQRTRRRRAEADLLESRERMSLAAAAANLGFWMWDVARDQIWAEPEGRSFFGWEKSERINLTRFIDSVHPDDREPTRWAIDRSLEHGADYVAEYRVVSRDGVTRWIASRGGVEFGSNGKPLRMRGISIDITERKHAAEALRQSEEHYRSLAETAADVIVTMDENSTILSVNPAVERVFGYTPADLIGQKITMLMPEPLRQRHVEGMRRYLETGEKLLSWGAVSFPGLHKSGGEINLEIAFAESRRGDKRVFTGIMRDITERKRAESELRRSRDELAHVMRIATMGELSASLAHELNQPLTAILSNAQAAQRFLAKNRVDVEEVREILRDIVDDNNRASEVIRRMRALVKKEELEFSSLDLTSMIREIVLLVHSDAMLRNVRVSFDFAARLPEVRGDKIQLQQVLLNLLLNAFDAMNDCSVEDREVSLRVEGGAGMVEVSVSDHGTGLTSDKLDKIFQPFFTTKREGLGMGLSISRSIIEAHGGRLWAENNNGRGATFHFTVPVAEERGKGCQVSVSGKERT